EYNVEDAIYFTGEETKNGQLTALDGRRGTLHVVPMVGRAAFESITGLDTGDPDLVAFLIGDDRGGAPLLLYVGQKGALGDGSFLDRNGLAVGNLFAWVSDTGDLSPEDWNGTGTSRSGAFVQVMQFDASMAGQSGYDAAGYADMDTLDDLYNDIGAFAFSRPEDLATNPTDGTQVVFASTGRDSLYPSDTWGTTYLIDVDFSGMDEGGAGVRADLTVLYDGDDAGGGQFPGPDYGLRNPDNLDWADDGYVYVQEDRTTSLFGQTSGHEARIWQLDPVTGDLEDIAVVERGDENLPEDQSDGNPASLGAWETSGILDVTEFFRAPKGATVLVLSVQAHTVRDGRIAEFDLVQGGQLVYLLGVPAGTPLADIPLDGLSFFEAMDRIKATAPPEAPERLGLTASPNPFNWSATITYSVPSSARVRIVVHDMLGREIATLADAHVEAGEHIAVFDGTDLPSGAYLVRMTTPGGEQTQRITLTK
ncbi:MAG: T9SS type A sorting domain-containing protein, partial [Rubricoccaceae bacterium]|nr:T9SS type A sorting domain-containing protein [Rubricoccaceae bacterium]